MSISSLQPSRRILQHSLRCHTLASCLLVRRSPIIPPPLQPLILTANYSSNRRLRQTAVRRLSRGTDNKIKALEQEQHKTMVLLAEEPENKQLEWEWRLLNISIAYEIASQQWLDVSAAKLFNRPKGATMEDKWVEEALRNEQRVARTGLDYFSHVVFAPLGQVSMFRRVRTALWFGFLLGIEVMPLVVCYRLWLGSSDKKENPK